MKITELIKLDERRLVRRKEWEYWIPPTTIKALKEIHEFLRSNEFNGSVGVPGHWIEDSKADDWVFLENS